MFINELSEKKQDKIVELLQEEDFTGIKKTEKGIHFKKGLRTYCLVSTDLSDKEDGLRVDFDYENFMATQYEEKSRHSVSLREAVDKAGSMEDGCRKLHWKISRVENLSAKSRWIAELYTEYIYEVKIGDHVHILVNETLSGAVGGLKVYAGTMDALWRMGTIPLSELLADSKLPEFLKQLARE